MREKRYLQSSQLDCVGIELAVVGFLREAHYMLTYLCWLVQVAGSGIEPDCVINIPLPPSLSVPKEALFTEDGATLFVLSS